MNSSRTISTMNKFNKGLIAAAYTSFAKNLSVNHQLVKSQLDYLLATGVKGVLVAGTTGEGYSLTNQERKSLTETWKSLTPEGFSLMVHVGHHAYGEVNDLALHARQIGVDGILLSTPCYLRPTTVQDLIRFLRLSLTGVEGVPVYYYHIPSLTGVNFLMADFLKAADGVLPDLRGIKFTHENLDDFRQCLQYSQYEMIFGRDELLLDAFQLGAQAALGSTYNFIAPLFNSLVYAHENGQTDIARRLQQQAVQIIEVMVKFGGGVVAGKAMMQIAGVDCGPLRPPLASLDNIQMKQLEQALQQTRFFEYIKAE